MLPIKGNGFSIQLLDYPFPNVEKIEIKDYPTITQLFGAWAAMAKERKQEAFRKSLFADIILFQDSYNLIQGAVDSISNSEITLYGYKDQSNKFQGFSALMFCSISHEENKPKPYLRIESLFTKPTNLRSCLNKNQIFGVGKALVHHAEELSYKNKWNGVILVSLTTSVNFYIKMGYEETRLYGLDFMLKTSEKIRIEAAAHFHAA